MYEGACSVVRTCCLNAPYLCKKRQQHIRMKGYELKYERIGKAIEEYERLAKTKR